MVLPGLCEEPQEIAEARACVQCVSKGATAGDFVLAGCVVSCKRSQDPKDVLTSDLLSPAEKEKLDKEIEDLSKKMDALWNERADRKEWDSVKADLAVYQYPGQNVTEDPQRVDTYRGEVVKELGFGENWKEKRPFLNEFDVAACREVLARKSGAFWLEGSPRTTVRNVMHGYSFGTSSFLPA